MKLIYFLVFCLVIINLTPPKSFCKQEQVVISSKMQFDYAKKLFETRDYETSMIEFKRFAHFFPDDDARDEASFYSGLCLFYLEKFYEAAKTFDLIISQGTNQDVIREAVFLQSKAFMKADKIGYAQISLQNYLRLMKDIKIRDRIYFELAKIHLYKASQKKVYKKDPLVLAKTYLSKISKEGEKRYKVSQYNDLIIETENAPYKSPALAGSLSAAIPGAGFLYCERYHDAFITFLLNAGLIYAAYESYDNDHKALAGVIGFVETGFYTGNIYGSITCAHKHNKALKKKILSKNFFISSNIIPEFNSYALLFNYSF